MHFLNVGWGDSEFIILYNDKTMLKDSIKSEFGLQQSLLSFYSPSYYCE